MNKTIIWIVVAIVVLGAAYWFFMGQNQGETVTPGAEGEMMEESAMTE